MNICMVLDGRDFPPDIRVEKEARALISAGHRVFLLCARRGNRPARCVWNGIEIGRIARLPFVIHELNFVAFLLSMRDLRWKRAIRELIETRAIDVIHVHDLPMLGTSLSAARRKGVPVIADLHENFPALVRLAWSRIPIHFAWPSRWERLERRWARSCARILVVVDEAKERLVSKGIPPEKITVIENTVDVDHFLSLPIDNSLVEKSDDFVLSYIGGFSAHRGLDTAVKAMPRILRDIPSAKLLLVGDGAMMTQLKALTKARGLDEKVVFTGWQHFEKVPSYVATTDVAIIPHHSNPHTQATCPHKLFQYMLMGKPVVVSSCRPLRRVVEAARCGFVFEAGDEDSLAETVLKLKDPAVRTKLGEAGRKAVREKHNWRKTSHSLTRVYGRVA